MNTVIPWGVENVGSLCAALGSHRKWLSWMVIWLWFHDERMLNYCLMKSSQEVIWDMFFFKAWPWLAWLERKIKQHKTALNRIHSPLELDLKMRKEAGGSFSTAFEEAVFTKCCGLSTLSIFFVRTYLASRKEEFPKGLMPPKRHFMVLSAIWDWSFTYSGFPFKNKWEAQQLTYLWEAVPRWAGQDQDQWAWLPWFVCQKFWTEWMEQCGCHSASPSLITSPSWGYLPSQRQACLVMLGNGWDEGCVERQCATHEHGSERRGQLDWSHNRRAGCTAGSSWSQRFQLNV